MTVEWPEAQKLKEIYVARQKKINKKPENFNFHHRKSAN